MSVQADNVAATQKLFEAFGEGDIPTILTYLNEDIVIEFYGPDVIPYAGTYSGKQEAQRFFETVLSSVDIHEFAPEEFLADAELETAEEIDARKNRSDRD